MKSWVVTVPGFRPVTIPAPTRSAAKYEAWKRYTDAGYKCSLIDFRASVRRPHDPI